MRAGQAQSQHEICMAELLQDAGGNGFILNGFILNKVLFCSSFRVTRSQTILDSCSFFFTQLSCKKDKVKEGDSEEGY